MRPAGGQSLRTTPPFDAIGPPPRRDRALVLDRESPLVPGPDTCSQVRVQTVLSINQGPAS